MPIQDHHAIVGVKLVYLSKVLVQWLHIPLNSGGYPSNALGKNHKEKWSNLDGTAYRACTEAKQQVDK